MSGRVSFARPSVVIVAALIILTTVLFTLLVRETNAQNRTLYWGSRSSEVVTVQQKLKQWGYYHGFNDGVYGSATYRAVREFQRRNALRADGVVGPSTWSALGNGGATAREPQVSAGGASKAVSRGAVSTSRDATLLARVIEGEAAKEPLAGKVAVGAVIMNRVKSSAFPNTLASVIYQPHAFESVSNGQINRPLTKESINAARQAMAGWDPSGGATFFWNPSKRVSTWIWSRQVIARIGRHVFAR